VMVVLAACGGTAPTTSSEPAAPSTSQSSPTSAPATTTHSTIPATSVTPTSAPTPTTIAPSAEPVGVLVANNSGIFFVPTGGEPEPVADGPVLAARDDLAGGVVAQLPGPEGRPGVVSLLPAGGEARIVLAPEGNSLVALEDVEVVRENPTVVGTVRTAVGNPESERQKLVTIDLVDGDRREVAVVGGYEAGGGPVSAEPNGFVLNKWLEAMNWVEFLDHAGAVREAPFNPNPECEDDVTCPRSVVASADGRLLAYLVTVPGEGVADGVDLVVVDAATGGEVAREGLPVAGFATVGVDIVGDLVLVNRLAADESGEPTEPTFPMVLDLATGDLTEVPLAGVGSLARTAPEVTGSLH
jgi:hypothetical protein